MIKFSPAFYPTENNAYTFGDLCHQQRQGSFPVWAITDLEGKILISNAYDPDQGINWVLLKARTNINRYWQSSTAFFQCTLAALDVTKDIPPAPGGLYRHPASPSVDKAALGDNTKAFESLSNGIDKIDIATKLKTLITWYDSITADAQTAKEYNQRVKDLGLTDTLNSVKASANSKDDLIILTKDSNLAATYSKNDLLKNYIDNFQLFLVPVAASTKPKTDINSQPLYILDEICIYAGYLDTMRSVTSQDIAESRLLRRGVWSVDTVTYSGSPATGIIWTVQCRDRLKYLMDTFGSYNTAEANEILYQAKSYTGNQNRSSVILSLARRGIGDLGNGISVGGRVIKQGFIYDLNRFTVADGGKAESLDPVKGGTDPANVLTQDEAFDAYRPYKGNINVVGTGVQAAIDSELAKTAQVVAKRKEAADGMKAPNGSSIKILYDEGITDDEWNTYASAARVTDQAALKAESVEKGSVVIGSADPGVVDLYQFVPTLQGSTKNMPLSKELKFNIITGKVNYTTTATAYFAQNFIVADRVPLDYIKFLSQQEPWVTEVFQDHRTGEYWYAPRGLDVSGLSDPKRFNRTYFFRQYPEDLTQLNQAEETTKPAVTFPELNPHMATMLTSFREEASAVSMRTNIIVQTMLANDPSKLSKVLHLSIEPPFLADRAYACSFFTITDDTATSTPGAMVATALAYARVIGKETRAAAATMIGDPSITPGEVIQVLGSPMHQGTTVVENVTRERNNLLEMAEQYTQFYKDLPAISKQFASETGGEVNIQAEKRQAIIAPGTANTIAVNEFMETNSIMDNAAENKKNKVNTITFNKEPETMWRVEGVLDRFNDGVPGYYTEVSLLSCF